MQMKKKEVKHRSMAEQQQRKIKKKGCTDEGKTHANFNGKNRKIKTTLNIE